MASNPHKISLEVVIDVFTSVVRKQVPSAQACTCTTRAMRTSTPKNVQIGMSFVRNAYQNLTQCFGVHFSGAPSPLCHSQFTLEIFVHEG